MSKKQIEPKVNKTNRMKDMRKKVYDTSGDKLIKAFESGTLPEYVKIEDYL